MSRIGICLYLVCLVLLVGCISNQTDRSKSRTETIDYNSREVDSLQGQVLSDADTIANPGSLVKVGEYLLVTEISSNPPAHILQLKDGSYLASLGTRGEGPGEFQGIWSFDVVSDSLGTVWAYDLNSLRLTYIPIPEFLEGEYTLGDSLVTLDIGYSPTDPRWLGDSLLVSPGFLTEKGRLAFLDPETGATRRIAGISPPNPDGDPMAVVQHAYQASMDDHPDDSLLVLATRYADRIEIYQSDGTRKALIQGPHNFDPVYEVGTSRGEPVRVSTDETRSGYLDVKATSSSIYALYSGRTQTEPYDGLGLYVHVLNWEGDLQAVYKLSNPVVGIAVDEAAGRLIAMRPVPTPAVVTYDLNSDSYE